MKNQNFTFIDLFSGVGGFRIPLEKLGGKCLAYSEIDKHAIDVFKNNDLDKVVENLWGKRFPTDNSFGNGQSAKKFTKILKNKKIWELNLQKTFFETSTK